MTLTYSSYKVLQRGSRAPDFSLKGTDGKTHSLEEFRGKKALLVIFMCNHCPYVIESDEVTRATRQLGELHDNGQSFARVSSQ